MANEKTTKPSKPMPSKASPSRRPTTIDLKATEIKAAAKPEQKPQEKPQVQVKPEPQPEDKIEKPEFQAKPETAPEPQMRAAAASAEPPHPKPDDVKPAADDESGNKTAALPWPLIAAGAGGAALFLAIGMGAGHWLSREMSQVTHAPLPVAQPAVPPELHERLAKLEAALAASRAPDPQLVARIAAAEAAAKTAADMAAARERRNDEIAALAREARDRASSAATTANEAVQKAGATSPEHSRAEIEALHGRIAALENTAQAHQAELAKRAAIAPEDARSRLVVTALSLRNAVDSGVPFAAELAAVRTLSGDAKSIAALEPFAESGVPTAASLGRELQAVMPAIWKAAQADEPAQGSFLERLQANAGKIVRVRPAGEAQGDDAPSVKARIETRAGNSDIRGALAELAKLPPDARAPAQAWIKKVEARNAALAAAQTIAQSALTALAKPGS